MPLKTNEGFFHRVIFLEVPQDVVYCDIPSDVILELHNHKFNSYLLQMTTGNFTQKC